MKPSIYLFLPILSSIVLVAFSGCSAGSLPNQQSDSAQDALTGFLENLHAERYAEATELYGGSYEIMIDHNPEIDPPNQAALLQNACKINGAQCLEVKSVVLEKKVSETDFVFKVEFLNADGSPFVLGACCGGSETDFPPQEWFIFEVVKGEDGKFRVLDMVPYMP